MIKAIEGNVSYEPQTLIICTDSMSSLQILASPKPSRIKHHLIAHLLKILIEQFDNGNRIHIVWMKAHHGLRWNEKADHLAKRATVVIQLVIDISTSLGKKKTLLVENSVKKTDRTLHNGAPGICSLR
uniref:Gag-Pol polyprotein n=1 Tax=Lygus hesperus TaxID=30085 RepID=A0A0A9WTV1_LYGHE